MSHPGKGPIRRTSHQRKLNYIQQRASKLITESLTVYLGLKNMWLAEHEIAMLSPARINALKYLYQREFDKDCQWSNERLSSDDIELLGLEVSQIVSSFDPGVVEFSPAEARIDEHPPPGCDTEHLVLGSHNQDSGISSGVVTPLLSAVADKLALEFSREIEVENGPVTFGSFRIGEVDALSSGKRASAIPESCVDFISDITLRSELVCNVLTPSNITKVDEYYQHTLLADLMRHCECSLLVKSLMDKPQVKLTRFILGQVRPRVSNFISRINDIALLERNSPIAVVNSLADDHYCKTGRKFSNRLSRIELAKWLCHLLNELHLGRLNVYLDAPVRPPRVRRPRR